MPARETPSHLSWWAAALGLVCGAGVAFVGDPAAVILVCAAIYLLAAATGRPGFAWVGFAASIPIIGAGLLLRSPWVPLAILALGCVVLVVVGTVRRRWGAPESRAQLLAVIPFGAVAVAVALLEPSLVAALIAAAALAAHGLWDLWHHRRAIVVTRPYAAFCAALDFVLAVLVVVRALL